MIHGSLFIQSGHLISPVLLPSITHPILLAVSLSWLQLLVNASAHARCRSNAAFRWCPCTSQESFCRQERNSLAAEPTILRSAQYYVLVVLIREQMAGTTSIWAHEVGTWTLCGHFFSFRLLLEFNFP
ncbi:hypothetical protein BDW62DRAFT_189227, partial [Aspergillus aurantiobrunneus]